MSGYYLEFKNPKRELPADTLRNLAATYGNRADVAKVLKVNNPDLKDRGIV